jgi:hypothetical protein
MNGPRAFVYSFFVRVRHFEANLVGTWIVHA